jgi:hypothetical protein
MKRETRRGDTRVKEEKGRRKETKEWGGGGAEYKDSYQGRRWNRETKKIERDQRKRGKQQMADGRESLGHTVRQ